MKIINRLLVLLLMLACIISMFTGEVSALVEENVIQFQSTYTKDGKFAIPVRICVSGIVSANLVDSNDKVIESFKTLNVAFGTTITYSRSFASTKSGIYYLNVKFFYSADKSQGGFSRKLKITHKEPIPKLAFTKTYQAYTDAGDILQVFKFDYFNANNKEMNFEVYDEYSDLIHKSNVLATHLNGSCTYSWDYYPKNGGLMVSNGIYILKYWVQGQTPKQIKFEVNLAEG